MNGAVRSHKGAKWERGRVGKGEEDELADRPTKEGKLARLANEKRRAGWVSGGEVAGYLMKANGRVLYKDDLVKARLGH